MIAKSEKKRMKFGTPTIIVGILFILSGVLFHFQGRAVIGPASSFMYSNPQWITYGQQIAIVGLVILAVGLVILKKKIRKKS